MPRAKLSGTPYPPRIFFAKSVPDIAVSMTRAKHRASFSERLPGRGTLLRRNGQLPIGGRRFGTFIRCRFPVSWPADGPVTEKPDSSEKEARPRIDQQSEDHDSPHAQHILFGLCSRLRIAAQSICQYPRCGVWHGRSIVATFRRLVPYRATYTNMVPLRLQIRPNCTVHTLVSETRNALLHALEHRTMQFTQMIDSLDLPRTPGRNPIFDLSLTLIEDPVDEQLDATCTARWHRLHDGMAQYDLSVSIHRKGTRWSLMAEYDPAVLETGLVDRFLDNFTGTLERMTVENPPLCGHLDAVSEQEHATIGRGRHIVARGGQTHRGDSAGVDVFGRLP